MLEPHLSFKGFFELLNLNLVLNPNPESESIGSRECQDRSHRIGLRLRTAAVIVHLFRFDA